MPENPNPQGKGHIPVLAALMESRSAVAAVPPKHIEQIAAELFTSLFVLESDFKFKPVPGRNYWLYEKRGRVWLSLIGPQEWNPSIYGRFIGECELQPDMTWTLKLSEDAAADADFMARVEERRRAFDDALHDARSVDDLLPHYKADVPFFQRACAFALARSLGVSMGKAGIRGLSFEQARGLLAASD